MKVRFTRRALGHITQIERDTLAAFGERVASEFLARVDRTAQNLAAFPLSGRPGRLEGTHEVPVPNTHFLIAYRLKGNGFRC